MKFCKTIEIIGLSRKSDVTVESVAWDFAAWFCESDEMAEMVVDEAKSWVKTLRKMSVEEICKTWPDMKPYVDALMEMHIPFEALANAKPNVAKYM